VALDLSADLDSLSYKKNPEMDTSIRVILSLWMKSILKPDSAGKESEKSKLRLTFIFRILFEQQT